MMHVKYYIILLIGIFLSLGLGILIGVTLENKDVLENQQILITRQIENEFSALRQEAEMLKADLENLEKEKEQADSLCNYLFSRLTENRLDQINIAMIGFSASDMYYELEQFLQSAGAAIKASVVIEPDLYTQQLDIAAVSDVFNDGIDETGRFYNIIAEELIFSIIDGSTSPLMNRVKDLQLINISINSEESGDIIILYGNGRDKSTKLYGNQFFDIALIQAAKNLGLPIIAVEPSSVGSSAIPEYKRMGVSVVENIDTKFGKLELVSLLETNRDGFEPDGISDDVYP